MSPFLWSCKHMGSHGLRGFFSIVWVSSVGNGLRFVLGSGCISLMGTQDSYSSLLLGVQHSQRYWLKSQIISAAGRRAHAASVTLSAGSLLPVVGIPSNSRPHIKLVKYFSNKVIPLTINVDRRCRRLEK